MKRTPLNRKTPMKRSGGLSRVSDKKRRRDAEAKPFRREMVAQASGCWICGTSPRRPRHRVGELNQLAVHEIACGSRNRHKAQDAAFATLVLCWHCNGSVVTDSQEWPESRQLSLLRLKNPDGYDLAAYNELVGFGPNRITAEEVDRWGVI